MNQLFKKVCCKNFRRFCCYWADEDLSDSKMHTENWAFFLSFRQVDLLQKYCFHQTMMMLSEKHFLLTYHHFLEWHTELVSIKWLECTTAERHTRHSVMQTNCSPHVEHTILTQRETFCTLSSSTAISHRGGKVAPQLTVIIYRCLLTWCVPAELQKPEFSDKNGEKKSKLAGLQCDPLKA